MTGVVGEPLKLTAKSPKGSEGDTPVLPSGLAAFHALTTSPINRTRSNRPVSEDTLGSRIVGLAHGTSVLGKNDPFLLG